jgi:hypothetical protein
LPDEANEGMTPSLFNGGGGFDRPLQAQQQSSSNLLQHGQHEMLSLYRKVHAATSALVRSFTGGVEATCIVHKNQQKFHIHEEAA